MTNASAAQITFIKSLLADRQHTDNGKTILVGEARFRTTADKIDTISKAVASRMITALKAAEMKPAEERKPEGPHFRNLGGKWRVAGVENGQPGDVVEVRTKAGDIRRVTLVNNSGSIMWEFRDAPEETTEIEVAEEQAPAPRRARSIYRRRAFECPRCGEVEGGMFNGGVCDECGYTEHATEQGAPAVEQDVPTVEVEQDTIPEKVTTPVAPERIASPRPVPARIQQEASRIVEAQGGRAAIYVRDGVKLARYSTQAEGVRAGWTVMTGLGAVVATGLDLALAMEVASAHIADRAQRREVAYRSARQQAAGCGPAARAYAAGLGHGVGGQVWDDD